MMARWIASSWFACALLFSAGAAGDGSGSLAIVVHRSVQVDELSMEQLRRIFLADQQFWPDNSRITLLIRAPGAVERNMVLEKIYQMSEGQFRQYWIAKIFRAEVPSGPKIVLSSNMALQLVTAIPGSITFMPATAVEPSVKVLRIDGALPEDQDYPLR